MLSRFKERKNLIFCFSLRRSLENNYLEFISLTDLTQFDYSKTYQYMHHIMNNVILSVVERFYMLNKILTELHVQYAFELRLFDLVKPQRVDCW
jgi:hypothetical protein